MIGIDEQDAALLSAEPGRQQEQAEQQGHAVWAGKAHMNLGSMEGL
jgi:hypothetical protein